MQVSTVLDPDPDPTQFHIQLRPDAASFPPPSFDSTGNFSIFFTPFSSLSPFDRLHFSGVQVASTPSRSISSTGDFRYLHQRHSEQVLISLCSTRVIMKFVIVLPPLQSPSLCQQLCIPTTTALIASSYALILSTHRRFEVFQIFRYLSHEPEHIN